jgi:hypothetical protein
VLAVEDDCGVELAMRRDDAAGVESMYHDGDYQPIESVSGLSAGERDARQSGVYAAGD